jgi:hypothetical protein
VISDNGAARFDNRGIWRTTDGGDTWAKISSLPAGRAYDLVGDPNDPAVLYTNAGNSGIYRSGDTGATWTKVSDETVDARLQQGTSNVEIAVAPTGAVFVGVVGAGEQLAAMFRSSDGDGSWVELDTPETTEAGVSVGIHPGTQGEKHFSIGADPTDDNIVQVSWRRGPGKGLGDLPRQPLGCRMPRHLEPQQLPPTVPQYQERKQVLKGQRRHNTHIDGGNRVRMISQNVFQDCDGDFGGRVIYFETVDWATSKPSIKSSPSIRGAPQSGFSLLIRQIRSRRPRSILGRPAL